MILRLIKCGIAFKSCICAVMTKEKRFILVAFITGVTPFLLNGFYNPFIARFPFAYWATDIIAWIILPATLLIVGIRKNYISFQDLGLRTSNRYLPIILISSIFACPIFHYTYTHSYAFAVSAYPVNHFNVNFSYQYLIPTAPPWSYITIVYFSLTAGFVEEILYRSLLFNLFENTFLQRIVFLITSSIIFSLVHWEGGVHNLHATLIVGAVAGIIFLLTKNIWPCIVGHVFTNLIHYS